MPKIDKLADAVESALAEYGGYMRAGRGYLGAELAVMVGHRNPADIDLALEHLVEQGRVVCNRGRRKSDHVELSARPMRGRKAG